MNKTYKSLVDWYYIQDWSDYPGPKGRVVPDVEGYDNPGDYEGAELYISQGTIGDKEGNSFVDEEGNDVPFEDQYFEKTNSLNETKMTNEQLRMQMLSGIITESEYKTKLEESKKPLNENFVGIGAINNPFLEREKTDYEMAFEHFTKGTSLNEEMEDEKDLEEIALEKTSLDENTVGTTVDKILQTFEFSQKGNDEMIEFGEYLLSPEGPKNIAMSIKSRLKGEGGEKYFTSDPEKLQAFLSKLR
jgi:hypothetical protein